MFPKIKEKLPIKTFGKEKEDLQDCGIVEFCVRGLSQSLGVQMTALTAPLICSPLTNHAVQFAQQSYSHLEDLELADQSSEDCGSKVPHPYLSLPDALVEMNNARRSQFFLLHQQYFLF